MKHKTPNHGFSKVQTVLSWILGILLILLGLSLLLVSFIAGISVLIIATLVTPKTRQILSKKISWLRSRKHKVILGCVCLIGFFVGSANYESGLQLSAEQELELIILLEEDLKMRSVQVSTVEDTLEIRFQKPTMPAADLYIGLSAVADILEAHLPDGIKTIRFIFTVDYIDVGFVSIEREAITAWQNGKLSNAEFIGTFERVSLL